MLKYALTLLMLLFGNHSVAANNWIDYENSRFGVQASVPASGFTMEPPPANNDGRKWVMNGGKAEFSIYGSYFTVAENFEGLRSFQQKIFAEKGIIISYEASGDGWFVMSGTKGNDIYYRKHSLNYKCRNTIINGFSAVYSANVKAILNPIVNHISRSLKGSTNGFGC